jgi:predicted transposase
MQVRVLKMKLSPTAEQGAALLALMQRFNEACNWVSQVAFAEEAFRRIPLQALCYHAVRERFGLPAQLAIHVTRKVGDSYAVDKSVCHTLSARKSSQKHRRQGRHSHWKSSQESVNEPTVTPPQCAG